VSPSSSSVDDNTEEAIYISLDSDTTYTSTGFTFTRYSDVTVISDDAVISSPTTGDTPITISGENFLDLLTFKCRFTVNDSILDVSPLSVSQIQVICHTPPVDPNLLSSGYPTIASLSISNNGVDFSSVSGMIVRYYTSPTVEHVSPSRGTINGGTVISVYGRGFSSTGGGRCMFSDTSVQATFISSNLITCTTPRSEEPESVSLSISNNEGLNYSPPRSTFTYTNPLTISFITPLSGPETGSTLINLHGSNFGDPNSPSSSLFCDFGSEYHRVSATIISNVHATCISPAHSPGPTTISAHDGQHPVEFEDGQFYYELGVTLNSVKPSGGSEEGGTVVVIEGTNFDDSER